VGEAKDYDYAANTCKGVCGYYPQLVWRKGARLGCGVANPATNSPFSAFPSWQIWVCNYDPPGNFNGEKPY
jgi:pathogenesis-related protein 1